jgi:predicted nucleotidyltransferase
MINHIQNITRIKAVYNALGELAAKTIFAGGAVVSLYADRPYDDTRPTDDIDIVVELIDYHGYAAIEETLRKKGFANDVESKVICRYKINGIVVDVMPVSAEVLGFSNKWYAPGFKQAVDFKIDELHTVKIFPAAYFIASKLEAFKTRGKNDGRTSSDFEDIVFVLNYRNEIWKELQEADEVVRKYLKDEFRKLLAGTYIDEWIAVHLDYNDQQRAGYIVGQLKKFISNQKN